MARGRDKRKRGDSDDDHDDDHDDHQDEDQAVDPKEKRRQRSRERQKRVRVEKMKAREAGQETEADKKARLAKAQKKKENRDAKKKERDAGRETEEDKKARLATNKKQKEGRDAKKKERDAGRETEEEKKARETQAQKLKENRDAKKKGREAELEAETRRGTTDASRAPFRNPRTGLTGTFSLITRPPTAVPNARLREAVSSDEDEDELERAQMDLDAGGDIIGEGYHFDGPRIPPDVLPSTTNEGVGELQPRDYFEDAEYELSERTTIRDLVSDGTVFRQDHVPLDGNCFFSSIAVLFFGDARFAGEVRAMLRRQYERAMDRNDPMQAHRGGLYHQLQAQTQVDPRHISHPERYGDLETQLTNDGYWASAEMLQLVADTFDAEVVVFRPEGIFDGDNLTQIEWRVEAVRGRDGAASQNRGHHQILLTNYNFGHWQPLTPLPPDPSPITDGLNPARGLPAQHSGYIYNYHRSDLRHLDRLREPLPQNYDNPTPPSSIPQQDRFDLETELRRILQSSPQFEPVRSNSVSVGPLAEKSVEESNTGAEGTEEDSERLDSKKKLPTGRTVYKEHPPKGKRFHKEMRGKLITDLEHNGAMTLGEAQRCDYIVYGKGRGSRIVSVNDSAPGQSEVVRETRLRAAENRRAADQEGRLNFRRGHQLEPRARQPEDPPRVDSEEPEDVVYDYPIRFDNLLASERMDAYLQPVFINIGRFSDQRTAGELLQAMASHMVVLQDYFATRAIARWLGRPAGLPFIPFPQTIHDFWFNDTPAELLFPLEEGNTTPIDQVRLIQVLESLEAQQPHVPTVYIIIRSIAGWSVHVRNLERIVAQYPHIPIRIIFAFRSQWMAQPEINFGHGAQGGAPTPIQYLMGPGNNPSPCNMFYSREILADDLAEVSMNRQDAQDNPQNYRPWAIEMVEWIQRAEDFRSQGLTVPGQLAQHTVAEQHRNDYQ